MIEKHTKSNDAISPVVGVMLMLVVTIIIAGLVAAFSSGLVGSVEKTPQSVIKATYSQGTGMAITHAGGDALSLAELKFSTMPSETMGVDYKTFEYEITKSVIQYKNDTGAYEAIMNKTTGEYSRVLFAAGDILIITQADCTDRATTPEMLTALNAGTKNIPYYTGGSVNVLSQLNWPQGSNTGYNSVKGKYFSAYQFMNPANIGNSFYLYIYDGNGNIISQNKVKITS